jgi:hypothetical protein
VSDDLVIVDFPFTNSMGLTLISDRTVEWIRLAKPIDPAQYDAQATALVEGYLEGRYGASKVSIVGSGKFRTGDGRLVYAFAGNGEVQQLLARWQGVVQFFDSGIALVAELVAQPTNHHLDPKGGIPSQPAVDWALTLQPGH